MFVPVRYAAVALGIDEIIWEEDDKSVFLKTNDTEILMYANSKTAYINGVEKTMELPPVIINSNTYIPIRMVAEAFGSRVNWDKTNHTVNIENSHNPDTHALNTEYNDNDIYWLSRIIEAESKGEPMEGKIAVGNVIINRRESPDFPDSIYEVIFEKTSGKYQFTPVKNKSIYNTPSYESLIAAKHALNDTELVGNALFFLNPKKTTSSWVIRNREYHLTINNHDFYL